MNQSHTRYVGMDVHTASIAVADVAKDHHAEVVSLGHSGTRPCDIDHLLRRLPSQRPPRVFVEDAGPCGSWLSRVLTHKGHVGWVVAPSLLPPKPGARVNTHRRDAITLATRLRSGDLTPVYVPTGADDALRDRCRARDETRRARKAAKVRLNALRLRQEIRDPGRATWSPAHLRWRSEVGWPTPAQPLVFPEDVRAVNEQRARLQRLAPALQEPGNPWPLQPVVEALQGRRGVPFPVAVTLVAERGDRTRGDNPRPLRRARGLLPAQSARGDRRRQGGITKAGNTHARRALSEGAWAYRSPAKVSRHRPWRRETRPTPLQEIRWKAQGRLCTRDRTLRARGKHPQQGVVARARELLACLWAIAREVPVAA